MEHKRILVVDDDQSLRSVLAYSIELYCDSCQVASAADGAEALDMLQERAFDLVLTDYNMPHMDGLELARVVRLRFPCTSVVLMSGGQHGADVASRASALNLKGFLLKPFGLEQIREILYL